MKTILTILFVSIFFVNVNAQSQTISEEEYQKVFDAAVEKTNTSFPFVFTVEVKKFQDGKVATSEVTIDERQSEDTERIEKTIDRAGVKTTEHQIRAGSGNVYCSGDGIIWTGPQLNECGGAISIYGRRTTESVEYSFSETKLNGHSMKVFREYSIFAPFRDGGKRSFRETISTINSKGLFIEILDTEGLLEPEVTTLTRKQTWKLSAKFPAIVAPK